MSFYIKTFSIRKEYLINTQYITILGFWGITTKRPQKVVRK